MTQEQLAEKLDVSRQTISKWESGKALPDLESVVRVCGLFGISVEELLGGEACVREKETGITLEDLARIHRENQRVMMLLIGGLLCLLSAVTVMAVAAALKSATASTQYLLYRYMVLGEYAPAPASYALANALAAAVAVPGLVMIFFCLRLRKRGRMRDEKDGS